MAWLKLHTDIIDDPKRQALTDRQFSHFVLMLCVASECNANGSLANYDPQKLSWRLRVRQSDIQRTINKLIEMNILSNDNGTLRFVNWEKRQYNKGYIRLKRHRKKKGNDNANDNANDNGADNANETVNTDKDIYTPPNPPLNGGGSVVCLEDQNIPFDEILSDLNEKANLKLKLTDKTKQLIRARWREGYTLDDFKHVHSVKADEWKGDPARRHWLHPDTLYQQEKFEKYLIQEDKNAIPEWRL